MLLRALHFKTTARLKTSVSGEICPIKQAAPVSLAAQADIKITNTLFS